jgi:hypothetical protein
MEERLFNYAKLYEIGLKETQSKTTNQKINEEIDMPKHSTRSRRKTQPNRGHVFTVIRWSISRQQSLAHLWTERRYLHKRNYAIIVLGGHIALLNVKVPPRVGTVVKDTIRRSAILKQNQRC